METRLDTPEQRKAFHTRPPTVFKYFSPNRVSVLSTLSVRYTPPAEFNDIFDSDHYFEDDDSLNPLGASFYILETDPVTSLPPPNSLDLIKEFVQASVDRFPGYTIKAVQLAPKFPDEESKRAYRRGFSNTFNSGLAEMVVFCVSSINDSNLMWAHYAAEHTGFCLGISTESRLFKSGTNSNLERVIYAHSPPIGPPEVTMYRRFLVKSVDWSYENEWRSMVGRSNASEVVTPDGKSVFLRNFDKGDITQIVLGSRASPELEAAVRAQFSDFEIHRCVKRERSYSLDITAS